MSREQLAEASHDVSRFFGRILRKWNEPAPDGWDVLMEFLAHVNVGDVRGVLDLMGVEYESFDVLRYLCCERNDPSPHTPDTVLGYVEVKIRVEGSE